MEELKQFASQQESKLIDQKENNVKKGIHEKRKFSTDVTDEESPAKRKKENAQPKKTHRKENSQPENVAESVEIQDGKGKADESDKVHEQGRKDAYPDKFKVFTDQCTAFVSNLDLKVCLNMPCFLEKDDIWAFTYIRHKERYVEILF